MTDLPSALTRLRLFRESFQDEQVCEDLGTVLDLLDFGDEEPGNVTEPDNVVLEARVRFTSRFTPPYDQLSNIQFRYNEGTWCADNLVDDMISFAAKHGCTCNMIERVDVISINGVPVENSDPGIPILKVNYADGEEFKTP